MFKNKLSFILNFIINFFFFLTVHCVTEKFTWIRSENLFDTISVILDQHKLVRHKSEALVWPEH